MSYKFVDNLRKFNRKERFYLIGMALGNEDFAISEEFTGVLQQTFQNKGIDFSDRRYVAMDYHLDWIYASLFLSLESPAVAKVVGGVPLYRRDEAGKCITATQQDIDLILAFGDESNPDLNHLIMLEAKGAMGWTNAPLSDKAGRLGAIFGHDGRKWKEIVVPHFAIVSPKKPSDRLRVNGFPEFMAPGGRLMWIEMPMPKGLQKVTRCDDTGRDNQQGSFWKIEYP